MRSLLIVLTLLATAATFYSALRYKSQNIEEDISDRVNIAVASEGGETIDVAVNGRNVTLSGLVASTAEETRLLEAADDTYGALGPVDGLILPQTGGGYLSAEKTASGITLRGSVASDAERAAILEAASTATDGTVTDALIVGAGGGYAEEAVFGLGQMAGLSTGTLMATDHMRSLSGTAPGDVTPLRAAFADRGDWSTALSSSDRPVDLSGDLAAANTALSNAQTDLTAQLSRVTGLEDQLASLSGRLADRDATITTLEEDVTSLRTQLSAGTDADSQLAVALADVIARDNTIDGLNAEIADLRTNQGDTAATSARITELEAETASLTAQLRTSNETVAAMQAEPSFAMMTAQQCDRQATAVLEGARINFASATADIEDDSVPLLERLTGIALACVSEDLSVEIGGHTDAQGSEEGNQRLSEARANAVVSFMTARGVPSNGLNAVGYGESQPIADNETAEGRAANRRISFSWAAQ